jgi:ARC6-like, IMS domain
VESINRSKLEDDANGLPVVTARLNEQADLWGVNGKQADSYNSVYSIEYKMLQRPDGSWRISDALVLGQ